MKDRINTLYERDPLDSRKVSSGKFVETGKIPSAINIFLVFKFHHENISKQQCSLSDFLTMCSR